MHGGVNASRMVRAWDLPTRLFHWGLVFGIASAWVSFEFAAKLCDPTLRWHRWNGYFVLTILVFRLFWGLFGSSTARFSSFMNWPWTALGYLRDSLAGRHRRFLGHNPAGTWMIVILFLAVLAQAALGLFTLEHNEVTAGPLQRLILDDEAMTKLIQTLHGRGFSVILGLVGVHVAANIAYQAMAKDKLISAMVTGRKPAADYEDHTEATGGSSLAAFVCLAAAIIVVFGGITLAGGRIV